MATAKIQVDIITPSRKVVSVHVDEVRAPGGRGGFGVRLGHTQFMTTLVPGVLTTIDGGHEEHYAVGGGFFEVQNDKAMVLVESAEHAEEIDAEEARKAAAEAAEKLKGLSPDQVEYDLLRARVETEAARILAAAKRR